MPQQQLDYAGPSASCPSAVNWRRVGMGASVALLLAIAVGAIWHVATRPLPVGQLTPADHQSITQLVAGRTADPIQEVKPRDTVVIVETLWHCYEFERTRSGGWRIIWEGS
jgi:hypothetical protein